MPDKILITGVSGYIGSWCVHTALEAGYTVVGTVRDKTSSKCQFLRDAMEGKPGPLSKLAASNLSLVNADLLSGDDAWDTLLKDGGFKYVLHTASPFFASEPKDPNDYLKPAIEGTTSVVKAAIKHNVARVVLTSSVAAIMDPLINGKTYSSADWSVPEEQGTYSKSKTLAEKAAWKLVEGTKTELAVICPSFVMGPTLYTDKAMFTGFESGALAQKVMSGGMPFVPDYWIGICGVCDVAKAHIAAMTAAGAGQRMPVVSKTVTLYEFVNLLNTAAPELKLTVRVAPSWAMFLASFFDSVAAATYPNLGKQYSVDCSNTTSILKMELTDVAVIMEQMAKNFIEYKVVG